MSAATVAEPAGRRRALARSPAQLLSDPAALAVLGLTVVAAFLRFWRIGHQGFWFDEGNTALLVHLSPGKMLGLIPQSESTPPLYYCIAWVWARIFGYGEAGLRSLSALAGVLTVPVVYGAAATLCSKRAGVIAAALTACNPLLIWYSQEARSYSLLVLLSAVSLFTFARVLSDPRTRTVAAWVVASAFALATHYYAFLIVIPEAAWLLWTFRRRRDVVAGIAIVGVCGLALIPLALSQNGTGNANWIGKIALAPRLGQLFPQFVVGFGGPAHELLDRLAELIALVAVGFVVWRRPSARGAVLAGGMLAAGLILNLLLVTGGIDDLITRNVLALWPAAAVLVAGGLAVAPLRARAGAAGVAFAGVLCAFGIAGGVAVAVDRNLQRPDWRAVARVLGPARPRLLLLQEYRTLLPLSLYEHHLRFWRRQPTARVSEIDVIAISAPRVHLCWWGAACNLTPSPAQSSYAIPGFRQTSTTRAYQFTIVKLVAPRPVVLTKASLAQGLTATPIRHDGLILQR
ncbi:MAG TPA: glycosyltransferase family 39 protein [Solirubrobacteraceae bacterium]|nr:glycosyltransferase family 39 protein [Solirubrobacteraceae bacterium]